jgi:hypothetical protein
MSGLIYSVLAAVAFFLVCFVMPRVIRTYLIFRGKRLLTCPETRTPVAVDVDAGHAAYTAVSYGKPELRLTSCSRWPERDDCDQECLLQVRMTPAQTLIRTMLGEWYEGKTCVYCGQSCGDVHWFDHKPALLSPEGVTMEWQQVADEKLPDVLATYKPVCWNCHICETFRREFSEVVTDRSYASAGAAPKRQA